MNNYYDTLFPYAYNILGSVEEASDAIQEVMVKYSQNKLVPDNEKNYLIRGVVNQSINRKKKLDRSVTLDGLPQPILTFETDIRVELKDLVSYSMLILLEQLNPKERAIFILKEAFSYSHNDIAEVLNIKTDNSRKIYSRAKMKIDKIKQAKVSTTYPIKNELLKKLSTFTEAIHTGNIEQLHQIFHEDIEFRADGGNKVQVVEKYINGKENVAKLCLLVYQKFHTTYTIKYVLLNHQPTILYFDNEELRLCQIFEITPRENRIISMNVILDPDKLQYIWS